MEDIINANLRMPNAARCLSCGALLGEASVVAIAPVCSHCGAVMTIVSGTLGLTSAYGLSDPTITRRRVEADLAVFHEYQMKYRGMREACLQQLDWGVERYAKLPQPPELLELKPPPPFLEGWGLGLIAAPLCFVGAIVAEQALRIIFAVWIFIYEFFSHHSYNPPEWYLISLVPVIALCAWIVCLLVGVLRHLLVVRANGDKPRENARRQKAHEEAMAAALKAAKPIKEAEDYRLGCQIRELEGLAKTVDAKEAEVRRILATL